MSMVSRPPPFYRNRMANPQFHDNDHGELTAGQARVPATGLPLRLLPAPEGGLLLTTCSPRPLP